MPKQQYFWGEWFRRRRFLLRHGEHYTCDPVMMTQQIRNAASARGLSISVIPGERDGDLFVAVVAQGRPRKPRVTKPGAWGKGPPGVKVPRHTYYREAR